MEYFAGALEAVASVLKPILPMIIMMTLMRMTTGRGASAPPARATPTPEQSAAIVARWADVKAELSALRLFYSVPQEGTDVSITLAGLAAVERVVLWDAPMRGDPHSLVAENEDVREAICAAVQAARREANRAI